MRESENINISDYDKMDSKQNSIKKKALSRKNSDLSKKQGSKFNQNLIVENKECKDFLYNRMKPGIQSRLNKASSKMIDTSNAVDSRNNKSKKYNSIESAQYLQNFTVGRNRQQN